MNTSRHQVTFRQRLMVLVMALCIAGCRTPHGQLPVEAEPKNPDGGVQPGELLEITFEASSAVPGFTKTWRSRVGVDGKIVLPFNVSVDTLGKSPAAIAEAIRSAYVPDGLVGLSIQVRREPDLQCRIEGEVRRPGPFPLMGQWTVLRAIDHAGGFTELADVQRVELHRVNAEVVRLDGNRARKHPAQDLSLRFGDLIVVPKQ